MYFNLSRQPENRLKSFSQKFYYPVSSIRSNWITQSLSLLKEEADAFFSLYSNKVEQYPMCVGSYSALKVIICQKIRRLSSGIVIKS